MANEAAAASNKVEAKSDDEAEFAEIMGELEKLQQAADAQPAAPSAKPALRVVQDTPSDISDFRADASGDSSMEDTLGAFKDDEVEGGVLGPEPGSEPSVVASSTSDEDESTLFEDSDSLVSAEDSGQLTMTLSGNMKLELKYAVSEQSVRVSFHGNMLKIELHDGTEFKVPFRKKTN